MYTLLSIEGGVCAPKGFFADGISAGLKPDNQKDLAFIHSETLCDIRAIFTTNRFQAAPILHFRKHAIETTNFVLINAKNANAMTGERGIEDIETVLEHARATFKKIQNPVMSSTGVIGVPLPKGKIMKGLERFDLAKRDGNAAAKAIMTTDSYEKHVAFEVILENGESFRIGAMAKGAGMINPAMATMLCFITTDAAIPADEMGPMLKAYAETTFNAISVDGDTSTNDTVMLLSNRLSGVYDKEAFAHAIERVMHELALKIVSDGEGATKCVAFEITGAANREEAAIAAKALTNSLLVKTALYGEDPNWGRIASTIGASGVACDPATLTITFGNVTVYERGEILFDEEREAKAAKVMQKDAFAIHCDLGIGKGSFTAYGCDLGHEYVKINADYRT
ncbi:bifunctional glutamate N-acetyltransferase/amino-acid acetyltransferase ArgJ [Hydrogenimonas cancrithermarum]|uniref:Arginine biosynthesis bifunctional protein ArgJ n=1 Tax=Hydrogenimonas cancrithermarum TaxID=2993563 RepID=A0ABN6WU91_9BACT|nr:bifunctional glutamate N-acetyltransferase/amino-acid acetyltransferase ArgJ [Hydrogenimonas cancrithermarum]BDY12684.1 arginine biosynthesis bifunctional protein ArgJ [Hydrogenimonas cancrithermarum]